MITQRQHLEDTAEALERLIVRAKNSTVLSAKVKTEFIRPLVEKVTSLRQRALLADAVNPQGRLM